MQNLRSFRKSSRLSARLRDISLRALLAGAFALACLPAAAAEETLVVHHFLSAASATHTAFIEPWARRIEARSEGRIEIEIFPSMTLGGKPPELYRQVRDGVVDIAWTLIGYTPGVFPRSEVFELPSVHRGSARATNLAIQENFELLAEDYKDLVPLLVHVHAGNALHLRNRSVRFLADVAGAKLRTPSRTGAWMIDAWGAEAVGMPVPALPQAISKGTVDGALVPFEIMPPLGLMEFTDYSVEGPAARRFGTSVFLLVMNRERYETLPDDLRAIVDATTGAALAEEAGLLWDSLEKPAKNLQLDSGGKVLEISSAAMAEFDKRNELVSERWIEEVNGVGIDGRTLFDRARASVLRHDIP